MPSVFNGQAFPLTIDADRPAVQKEGGYMQHPNEHADALKCIRDRRYTPAASFMVESMVEKAVSRISAGQRANLTTIIARKLRQAHTRLLMAQSGGVALRAMAEQAYREVEGQMVPTVESTASESGTA
jgi:hypothetical protein